MRGDEKGVRTVANGSKKKGGVKNKEKEERVVRERASPKEREQKKNRIIFLEGKRTKRGTAGRT